MNLLSYSNGIRDELQSIEIVHLLFRDVDTEGKVFSVEGKYLGMPFVDQRGFHLLAFVLGFFAQTVEFHLELQEQFCKKRIAHFFGFDFRFSHNLISLINSIISYNYISNINLRVKEVCKEKRITGTQLAKKQSIKQENLSRV